MALRNMVYIGDDTLRKRAKAVTDFGERTNMLIDDMWDTMKSKNGLGLAAPQVGILRRVAIVDVPAPVHDEEHENTSEDAAEKTFQPDTEKNETNESNKIDNEKKYGKYELINPVILESDGEICLQEGCLSVPEKLGTVKRPAWIKVQAQDRYGAVFTVEGEDMLARAICHELDHLNGVLFVDIAEEIEDLNEN